MVRPGERGGPSEVQRPAATAAPAVYLIAVFFTAEWLFLFGRLVYTLVHSVPTQARLRFLHSSAMYPLIFSELNGLFTVVAVWLLVGSRRIGLRLLLASTLLLLGLGAISWPPLIDLYTRNHNPELLRALGLGGSNLILHLLALLYAFRLDRRGLLR